MRKSARYGQCVKDVTPAGLAYGSPQICRAAFTLVELLVVIAIIAILASMLAPALSRAKGQGYRSACNNNLRQISLATRLYAQDNQDYLPYVNIVQLDNSGVPGWLYNGSTNMTTPDGVKTGVLWAYIGITNTYWCPGDRNRGLTYFGDVPGQQNSPPGPRTQVCSSYCINANVSTINVAASGIQWSSMTHSLKWTDFKQNDICYWESDEQGGGGPWNDGCNTPWDGMTHRHGEGGNIVGFDGHVEWISQASFILQAAQQPSRLWCNPNTINGSFEGNLPPN